MTTPSVYVRSSSISKNKSALHNVIICSTNIYRNSFRLMTDPTGINQQSEPYLKLVGILVPERDRFTPSDLRRLFRGCYRLSVQGQGDAEGSSASAGACACPASDPSLVSLDDRFGDTQPEPCSTLSLCTEEWLKDLAQDGDRNSASVVGKEYVRFSVSIPRPNLQGALDG